MAGSNKILHRDVFLATVLTFALLVILKLVIINAEYLNPIARVFEDFQFTDIYYSEYKKEKTEIDTNIVLVNIGEQNRLEIAQQLQTIKAYNPKLVALDITFKDRKEPFSDSILKQAFNGPIPVISVSNIVYDKPQAHRAFEVEVTNPYFERSAFEGYGNFIGEENQTVRYFTPFLSNGDKAYKAFATKIVEAINPDAYQTLLKRNHKTEIINYQGNSFSVLDADDFTGRTDLNILRGKIVLMGYMGPDLQHKVFEDNHLTPLNKSFGGMAFPDKYGVEIHAAIISMVLQNKYINEVPLTAIYIIAFIVCMLHMYVFIYLFLRHHKWFHIGAITLQIFSFACIVSLSLFMFKQFNLKLEPAYILAGVVISVEALYFYEALVQILHSKFGFNSKFIQKH